MSGEEFHEVGADGLAAWLEASTGLASRALQPTGFNHPAWAAPTIRHLGGTLALVARAGRVVAALPVVRRRLPFPLMESRLTNLGGSGAPMVDREAPEALAALLSGIGRPVYLRQLPVGGPVFAALKKATPHFAIINQWQRAALAPEGSFDRWFKDNFDSKRRQRFRRNRERLGAGAEAARSETLQPGEDCQPWVDEFLALEDAGWKGKRGTALARSPADRAAFREAACALHQQGRLRFWRIRRGANPVASMWGIHEGETLWLVKTAYDEAVAAMSPGQLVMLDATAWAFGRKDVALVDSCAVPGHPMVDNFWRGRIAMADVLVAPPQMSAARFAATVAAETAYRRGRALAKRVIYRLLGRKLV